MLFFNLAMDALTYREVVVRACHLNYTKASTWGFKKKPFSDSLGQSEIKFEPKHITTKAMKTLTASDKPRTRAQ